MGRSHRATVWYTGSFGGVLRWELQLALGRTRRVWWLTLALAGGAIVAFAWWAAVQPQEWMEHEYGLAANVHKLAVIALLTTPFRDRVIDISQATFGYASLRILVYALVGFAKLVLPALAAGSIGNDRRTGRMEELRITPLSISSLFLAKAIAIAAPFLLWGAIVMAPFSVIALGEYVPAGEIVRLWLEFCGQVAAITLVGLLCSAVFRSPWTARVIAYPLVWLILPAGWALLLWRLVGHEWAFFESPDPVQSDSPYPGQDDTRSIDFGHLCILQAALTLTLCLFAFYVGASKLHVDGFWGAVRAQARSLRLIGRGKTSAA